MKMDFPPRRSLQQRGQDPAVNKRLVVPSAGVNHKRLLARLKRLLWLLPGAAIIYMLMPASATALWIVGGVLVALAMLLSAVCISALNDEFYL